MQLLSVSFGFAALASTYTINAIEVSNQQRDNLLAPNTKSVQFFKSQVERGQTINSALIALLDRYPQKTAEFVAVALSAYPEHYKTIIAQSINQQPMFVDEIIIVANDFAVASPTEIIEIAVNAEPSYAGMATSAACKHNPEQFLEIVKSAVNAEPDSADQIAQKLVASYPSKTMEILITTIKEVPYVGKYVLDALLATVSDDKQSEEMIIMSIEQLAQYPDAIERLVQLAKQRDIESEKVRLSAMKGGLSEQEIAAVMDQQY